MGIIVEYRIEVETHRLSPEQQAQFLEEARRAGFKPATIHNGWTLVIAGLTQIEAVTIRDGLLDIGIHSSIGISD